MIYSDQSLITLKEQGYLPEDVHIGPSSVDLTLSSSFCCLEASEDQEVDIRVEQSFYEWTSTTLLLKPNEFVLAILKFDTELRDMGPSFSN